MTNRLLLAVLLLPTSVLLAQEPPAATASVAAAPCSPLDKPKPSDADGLIAGFRYGTPQKASAYSGRGWGARFTRGCADFTSFTVDIGMGGTQASAGYGLMHRRLGSLRIQESLLRTWGHPWQATTNTWYVGTELQWAYLFGLRVGRFYQIGGPSPRRSLTALSFVVGT
jgi:hypothetical protein